MEIENEIEQFTDFQNQIGLFPALIECSPPSVFGLQVNAKNEVLVNGQLIDSTGVVIPLVNYLSHNKHSNDLNSNAPLYMRITKVEIENQINKLKKEIKRIENSPDYSIYILDYHKEALIEWEQLLGAIKTIRRDKIPLSAVALIKLQYSKEIEGQTFIRDSVVHAYMVLRNDDAQSYFKKSYLDIFIRFKLLGLDADKNKLEALKIMCPVNVYDVPNLKYYYNTPLPPPPI